MQAAHQYANKAETANMLDLLRIGGGNGEKLAVRQGGSFRAPPLMSVHCLRPGGDHPMDRDERMPGAGDRDLQTPVDRFRGGIGPQRDFVHVDEMLTQRFEIDLRPIGLRVSVKDLCDLLDCSEGILAGHCRRGRGSVHTGLTAHHALVLAQHLLHWPGSITPARATTARRRRVGR